MHGRSPKCGTRAETRRARRSSRSVRFPASTRRGRRSLYPAQATDRVEKKPKRTKEDWERGWKYIEPIFGDVDPQTVTLETLDLWHSGNPDQNIAGLLQRVGDGETNRAMKYWRALWKQMGRMTAPHGDRYCDQANDPSLGIRRVTPKPRDMRWTYDEACRLVERAWRMECPAWPPQSASHGIRSSLRSTSAA
jgi:hypothetical protein